MPGIYPRNAQGESPQVRRRTTVTRHMDDSDGEDVGGTATIVSSTR